MALALILPALTLSTKLLSRSETLNPLPPEPMFSTIDRLPPEMIPLAQRIERLSGCQGQWVLDLRNSEDPRGYDAHYLSSGIYRAGYGKIKDPKTALKFCADHHWRGARLLFCADKLNADCSWPGGYDAPSIYRSNNRVFSDEFRKELSLADGDFDGLSLDVRFLTLEMIEQIETLEDYPLLSEDDHSELELELQEEAWELWVASDWRRIIEAKLNENLEGSSLEDCADEILDKVEDLNCRLYGLFEACREMSNNYWEEELGSQWINLDSVASCLDLADLRDLTGLPLLAPDQHWRREPYPWTGAEPAPLISELKP